MNESKFRLLFLCGTFMTFNIPLGWLIWAETVNNLFTFLYTSQISLLIYRILSNKNKVKEKVRKRTYKMPTSSRVIINVMTLNENADKRAHINPPPIEMSNTRLRPVVSAKNPHKCELITIPM